MTRRPLLRRALLLVVPLVLAITACQETNSMGITPSKVDTKRYFDDPALAAFADDLQAGRLSRVKEALRAGINPNAVGNQGFTPLFFVFAAPDAEGLRALLAAGAKPNVRLDTGAVPLYYAVRLANPAFTQALLGARADPNARAEHEQPVIHEAVLANQPEQLQLLARAGADINVVWGTGTPLYAAVAGGAWSAAATLLDLGADPSWRSPGGRHQDSAADIFCHKLPRVQPTAANRAPLRALFESFARRGVSLACAAEAARFR